MSTLTRNTVTVASRIMLPAYPLLCAALAVNYMVDRPRLLSSPALTTADHLLPLPVWGGMFGIAAVVLVVGLVCHHRLIYLGGLVLMCAAMLVWTAVFGYSAVVDDASATAAAWPAFTCAACWATVRSLTTGEHS